MRPKPQRIDACIFAQVRGRDPVLSQKTGAPFKKLAKRTCAKMCAQHFQRKCALRNVETACVFASSRRVRAARRDAIRISGRVWHGMRWTERRVRLISRETAKLQFSMGTCTHPEPFKFPQFQAAAVAPCRAGQQGPASRTSIFTNSSENVESVSEQERRDLGRTSRARTYASRVLKALPEATLHRPNRTGHVP